MEIKRVQRLNGEITVPGDKSISHRSVMFGAIANGLTEVSHFLQGADCLSTISCFAKMGIHIENDGDRILVHGQGMRGLSAPDSILDTGNSGTTTRLISGILAAQNFSCILNGDESIQKRPMKRIIDPLSMMGANIKSIRDNGCTPLEITGSDLTGIQYYSHVASAQVKSAILLAGLYAEGETRVNEPHVSRNHTELMLKSFGANVWTEDTTAIIQPASELYGQKIIIPGDISSAAYFIVAGLITGQSEIVVKNVGINPTRDGLIEACQKMGANLKLENVRHFGAEPVADIVVKTSNLKGTIIEGSIIPRLIDELPVIAVLACFADGKTIIKDAAELKVKESNRIDVMTKYLAAMGADITATDDGMIIQGGRPLHGAEIDSHMDHRIAMSFAVAGLNADGITRIKGSDIIDISYPGFYRDLMTLSNT